MSNCLTVGQLRFVDGYVPKVLERFYFSGIPLRYLDMDFVGTPWHHGTMAYLKLH